MNQTEQITYPIKTKRLLLTPYTMDFCEDLFQLKQLPETHRYNYTQVISREEAVKYVEQFSAYDYHNPKARFELAVVLKETKNYIGFIGFKGDAYKPDSTAEIYYTLHPVYFNKGLGTEAVAGMLDFGFNVLKLHRIWAGATCENTASWKIMEKTGMRKESHWVADRPKPGKWVPGKGFEKTGLWEDGYGYAVLKNEFEK
ncbi:MAG: GNAT family N-acetyltransferase [Spirochaetia bacterium]|jgi:ribosomal-protein-alanine N-acetyltransferase